MTLGQLGKLVKHRDLLAKVLDALHEDGVVLFTPGSDKAEKEAPSIGELCPIRRDFVVGLAPRLNQIEVFLEEEVTPLLAKNWTIDLLASFENDYRVCEKAAQWVDAMASRKGQGAVSVLFDLGRDRGTGSASFNFRHPAMNHLATALRTWMADMDAPDGDVGRMQDALAKVSVPDDLKAYCEC